MLHRSINLLFVINFSNFAAHLQERRGHGASSSSFEGVSILYDR